jgi:hypothetical protein
LITSTSPRTKLLSTIDGVPVDLKVDLPVCNGTLVNAAALLNIAAISSVASDAVVVFVLPVQVSVAEVSALLSSDPPVVVNPLNRPNGLLFGIIGLNPENAENGFDGADESDNFDSFILSSITSAITGVLIGIPKRKEIG